MFLFWLHDNHDCSAIAAQLGKPAPDNHATQLQTRVEIGSFLHADPGQWLKDIESLVNQRTHEDEFSMTVRALRGDRVSESHEVGANKMLVSLHGSRGECLNAL